MGGEALLLPALAARAARAARAAWRCVASQAAVAVLAAALTLAATASSEASDEDELYRAAERVADLYAMHEAKEGEAETVLSGKELSKQFFHPLTAIAMQGRRFTFDPIYAGGTRPITDIEIFPDTETGIEQGAGFVLVTFKASEEPHRLRYSLIKLETDDTWWIIDIEGEDWSLKRLLIGR